MGDRAPAAARSVLFADRTSQRFPSRGNVSSNAGKIFAAGYRTTGRGWPAHVVPRSNRSARLACTVPAVPARSSRRHARACHSGAAAALGRETRISRQGPAGPVQGRRSNRRSRGSRGQADRPGRGPGRARGAPRCWLLAPCVSRPSVRPTGNAELRASLPITRQAPLSIVRCAASEIPQARRLRRLDAVAGKIHHCCQL
jgi:hypothetical protein